MATQGVNEEFDDKSSKAARDEGINRVKKNNRQWCNTVIRVISGIHIGWTGTGEDIRRAWQNAGGPPPSHHNAWGAVINSAVKRGLLTKIGMQPMKFKRSHARLTAVYRR